MNAPRERILGIRYLKAADRIVPVILTRNEAGTVAARCLLDAAEQPIIDAASVREAMELVEASLDGLLLARQVRA